MKLMKRLIFVLLAEHYLALPVVPEQSGFDRSTSHHTNYRSYLPGLLSSCIVDTAE